jgi:hypothetical protein
MVRSISNRLKGSKFGISPHYPQEVLERRNKLIPIMLKERKNNQKAYIAGDKLINFLFPEAKRLLYFNVSIIQLI